MLSVNMLLEWRNNPQDSYLERILWIDRLATEVVAIQITPKRVLPMPRSCKEIDSALAKSEVRVLEVDPYAALRRPDSEIPEKHRRHRDQAWELIASLVTGETEEALFSPRRRGPLIAALAKRTGRAKWVIYDYLRRYWQAGRVKNALLPSFDRCGGKGKPRLATNPDNPKRGCPSRLAKATNQSIGINVDADMEKRFARGIQLFYEKPHGRNLRQTFQRTLEALFHRGYHWVDGHLVPSLPSANELPTFRQFQYWYHNKYRDLRRETEARQGPRRFQLRHWEVLGDSTQMAFGPGSIYQIDATIGDIYLVSSLDRTRIIGRPVIYVLIDVFSRLITGFSVSLEGPSWLGAMLALDNVTQDKAAFCQGYGITITEADWPSHHLPEALLADRGELEGYSADALVNPLNVRVHNTPPYRADWKGIVEQNFRLTNHQLIHFMPGAVHAPRERGDKDYRLDAVLTLHEFRQLMIYLVLHHNQHHRMDWYRMDEFMIADHVEPYPIDLWNWGIQNRAGHLRTVAQEVVRLNLLPQKKASVTYRGIYFEGLLYSGDLAMREQWFIRARAQGSWKISVSYDPRLLDTLYLRLEGGRRLEPCQLIEADKTFRGRDWHEAVDYFARQKQSGEATRTREQQARATLHAQQDQIVSQAKEKTEGAQKSLGAQSRRKQTQGIRENRILERAHERKKEAWQLAAENPAEVIPMGPVNRPEAVDDGYVPPPQDVDKIRKLCAKMRPHES